MTKPIESPGRKRPEFAPAAEATAKKARTSAAAEAAETKEAQASPQSAITRQLAGADRMTSAGRPMSGASLARASAVSDMNQTRFLAGKRLPATFPSTGPSSLEELEQKLGLGAKPPSEDAGDAPPLDSDPRSDEQLRKVSAKHQGPGFGGLGRQEVLDQLNAPTPVELVFKTPLHAEMTEQRMESASMGPLIPGALIFTSEHIEAIVAGNKASDHTLKLFSGWNHFDGLSTFGEVKRNWDQVQSAYGQVIGRTDSKEAALAAFGEVLHAAQDFYAHSNYVDLFRDYFKEKSGRFPESRECPLYEEGLKDPAFGKILERHLATGSFTIIGFQRIKPVTSPMQFRNETPEARSKREQGVFWTDIGDGNPYLGSHSQMAKDDPKHELHGFAADLARRQTGEEIRKFKNALDDNPVIHWPRTRTVMMAPPPVMQKGPLPILDSLKFRT